MIICSPIILQQKNKRHNIVLYGWIKLHCTAFSSSICMLRDKQGESITWTLYIVLQQTWSCKYHCDINLVSFEPYGQEWVMVLHLCLNCFWQGFSGLMIKWCVQSELLMTNLNVLSQKLGKVNKILINKWMKVISGFLDRKMKMEIW